jgi:hypothetical protein
MQAVLISSAFGEHRQDAVGDVDRDDLGRIEALGLERGCRLRQRVNGLPKRLQILLVGVRDKVLDLRARCRLQFLDVDDLDAPYAGAGLSRRRLRLGLRGSSLCQYESGGSERKSCNKDGCRKGAHDHSFPVWDQETVFMKFGQGLIPMWSFSETNAAAMRGRNTFSWLREHCGVLVTLTRIVWLFLVRSQELIMSDRHTQ